MRSGSSVHGGRGREEMEYWGIGVIGFFPNFVGLPKNSEMNWDHHIKEKISNLLLGTKFNRKDLQNKIIITSYKINE